MFSPQEVEAMIQDTGGVPVILGALTTWGHVTPAAKTTFGEGGGLSREGGTPPTADVVTIANGLGAVLAPGGEITVDGVEGTIRAYLPDADGSVVRILLASRTHVIDVYRWAASGVEDAWGKEVATWTLVAGSVPANLEPDSGSLQEGESGPLIVERWSASLPAGTAIREGDRVLVTSGVGPPRFRVEFVAEHGPGWDVGAKLISTEEVFP